MKLSQISRSTKKKSSGHGTQEWSVKTVNCITGCSHNCRYCYAKGMAVRFKQVAPVEWPIEHLRPHDVVRRHKKYDGQVMFASSHDIPPINVVACLKVLKNLLKVGNRVLVVSKPHIECIERICNEMADFRDQLLFRFTIGACDDRILSYWEPNAPPATQKESNVWSLLIRLVSKRRSASSLCLMLQT